MDKAGHKFSVTADPVSRSSRGRSPARPTRPGAQGTRVLRGRTRGRGRGRVGLTWVGTGGLRRDHQTTGRLAAVMQSRPSPRRPGDRLPEEEPQALSRRTLYPRGASALQICPTHPEPSHTHTQASHTRSLSLTDLTSKHSPHTHKFSHTHKRALIHIQVLTHMTSHSTLSHTHKALTHTQSLCHTHTSLTYTDSHTQPSHTQKQASRTQAVTHS